MKLASKKKRPPNIVTIMLVPHYSGQSRFAIKMPKWVLVSLVTSFFICILIFSVSLFYSSSLTRKLINYSSLVAQTQLQKHQIGNMRKQTAILDSQIRELLERDQQLRGLLGLGSFNMDKATAKLKKKSIPLDETVGDINNLLTQIQLDLNIREESYKSLKTTVKSYQNRFAHTPSIWPVYGRMGSLYGWRRHPILRRWHFHQGVDFPTWYGAPVKCTADGVIEKVGWIRGYGKTVIINHLYGIKTLYAHNSRFLVTKGMKVKKGQVIAEAGSTGLSTGTHVHYEVIKGRKPIYPNRYLTLDLFTAAKKKYW